MGFVHLLRDTIYNLQQHIHQRATDEASQLKRRRLRRNPNSGEVKEDNSSPEKMGPPAFNLRNKTSKSTVEPPSKAGIKKTSTSRSDKDRAIDAISRLAENVKTEGSTGRYQESRRELVAEEEKQSWDAPARSRASKAELRAQELIFYIREAERVDPELFGNLPGEAVPSANSRDMGGRFLVNLDRITRSKIFRLAKEMPKGCHQHLHFNSEIPPERLFPHARSAHMEKNMFIRSTKPLLAPSDFKECEIVFQVLPKETTEADIFSPNYDPSTKGPNSPWMLWKSFRESEKFPRKIQCDEYPTDLDHVECWAREKMIISLEHAYGDRETHNSAWACFNQGTRAFKGLLGYETVYRWYIGAMVDSMIYDKVMYAELRPMLLDKNLPSDDGTRMLGHSEQMRIICEEVKKKQDDLKAKGLLDKFPFGVKIIYCTPRSIPRQRMQSELEDCLKLKTEFPDLICGFDLVGAEDRPNSIGFYGDVLVAFQETCKKENLSIPFMFHAGETLLDTGGSNDPKNSNLYDSLLLSAKRIGHGYALLKHPLLLQRYREQKICLELCPISNELLKLCGNAREHPYPELLAAGLPCTLNADNPSLFRYVYPFS